MPEELILERLHSNLERLRLPRVQTILLEVVRAAEEQGHSYY